MEPEKVLEAARAHAYAEAIGDMDATLATLGPDPVFEFYPARLTLKGWDTIEKFYREQYSTFSARVVDAEVFGEWANDNTAIQEYSVTVKNADDDGRVTYRVLSMSPVLDDGKLAGERLFTDDGFLRALLGDLYDLCEPIA